MALKDKMMTISTIAEKNNKNSENKMSRDEWKNKFSERLDELGIDSRIFLSGNREKEEKGGKYIFSSLDTPELLLEFFEIFEKRNGQITFEECKRIITILCEILPGYKNEREISLIAKVNCYKRGNEDISEMEKKILDDMQKAKNQIIDAVTHYYGKRIGSFYFEKILFIKTDKFWEKHDKNRQEFNRVQCEKVGEWKQYWKNVFREYAKFKIVEKYSISLDKRNHMKQEDWVDFCLGNVVDNQCYEKQKDENRELLRGILLDKIQNEEKNKRNKIFISVKNYNTNETIEYCKEQISQLMKWKGYLKDDFEYMIIKAFEDLENRYRILNRYKALLVDIEKIKERGGFIEDIGIEYFEIMEECLEDIIYPYV